MFKHLKIEQQAWLAGIMDGEGMISLVYHKGTQRISIAIKINMTHGETIRRCYKLFGTGTLNKREKHNPKHKDLSST
jgi:hypothetical protein